MIVWSPSRGILTGTKAAAHWTLSQHDRHRSVLQRADRAAPSGDIALLGGDIWNGSRTTNVGNNNSNLFNPTTDT